MSWRDFLAAVVAMCVFIGGLAKVCSVRKPLKREVQQETSSIREEEADFLVENIPWDRERR